MTLVANYEGLLRLAVTFAVGLHAVGCGELEESTASGGQSVIFGEDNRQEAFEQSKGTVGQRIAAGTVALVDASRLDLTEPSQVKFESTTLGERLNLCADERYRSQPSLAHCSGTLIAPDLVLTAGHCIDAASCASTKILLGYQMQDSAMLSPMSQEQVYSCSEVVVRSFDSVLDFAIIRLERAAQGVVLAPVKVGPLPLPKGKELVVAGYPSGIPLKVAGGATVLDGRERSGDFFMADLDAFPGNSGGGVYTADSGELAGVLVRGPNPGYERRNGESCFRAEQSDPETDTLIESIYVHHAVRAYCEVASDARLCACGDGMCDGSVGENTATCSEDCGSRCGDSACNGTEAGNDCYSDCGYCGNGICESAEQMRMSCNADCGCPPGLMPNGTNCVPVAGNVNGDEVVDFLDVLTIRTVRVLSTKNAAADVDCNGIVDEADVATLKRFVKGGLTALPCNAVASLGLGGQHSCAVMQSGRVRCWGDNSLGQLGLGNIIAIGSNDAAWATTDAALSGAVASLAAGSGHNCALLVDGSVQCWGEGSGGKLGYGDTENVGDDELPKGRGVLSLGAKASFVAVGGTHSCAILEGGLVRCWGSNDFGQLGTGSPDAIGDDELPTAMEPIAFDSPAVALALGFDFSCALLESGAVRCWGENFLGQLGRGDWSGSDPFEVATSAPSVEVGGLATRIAAGLMSVCVLRTDSKAVCWGDNSIGQLGYGHFDTIGDDEVPVEAGALPLTGDTVELTMGSSHVCSRGANGAVRCWGNNESGELGSGNVELVAPPLTLDGLLPVPLGGSAKAVVAGARHNCALLEDGGMRCWGNGLEGQLGYGNRSSVGLTNTPRDIGNVPLVAVSSGEWHFVNSLGLSPETRVVTCADGREQSVMLSVGSRRGESMGALTAYYDFSLEANEPGSVSIMDDWTPGSSARISKFEDDHYSVAFEFAPVVRGTRASRSLPHFTREFVRLTSMSSEGAFDASNDYSALDSIGSMFGRPTQRVQIADERGTLVYGWSRGQ